MKESSYQYNRGDRKSSMIVGVLALLSAVVSFFNLFIISRLSYITPVLLVINIVFMIYWIRKKDPFMIIPILAAISQTFPIPAFYHINNKIPIETDKSIKVATYNVRYFQQNHISTTSMIFSIMEKEDVDMVCFQEFIEDETFKDSAFYNRISSYFPYSYLQQGVNQHNPGLAFFSKHPIMDGNKELFKNEVNSAMFMDVDYNGTIIRVINCHLQTTGVSQSRKYGNEMMIRGATYNSQIRNKQVDFLARLIDDTRHPLILCGDFNDPPFSYSYRMMNRRLNDGFKKGGHGFSPTFIGSFKGLLRIDYIFHSDDMKCADYKTLDHKFSDHLPVISTLEFK